MLGKELECMHEIGNVHDLYAVGVVRTGTGTIEQAALATSIDDIGITCDNKASDFGKTLST